MDYLALSAKTTNNKFLIHVIDELLQELHGAKFFPKLDLPSGYYQSQIWSEDSKEAPFIIH